MAPTRTALRLLGPVRLHRPDVGELTVAGGKARTVLAALGLWLNQFVSVEQLVHDVWGDHSPSTARNTLQVYVSTVRRGLERVGQPFRLERSPDGYRLCGEPEQVDWLLFQKLVERARMYRDADNHAQAAEVFTDALTLWSSAPLADAGGTPLYEAVVPMMEAARIEALGDRSAAQLDAGEAVPTGELADLARALPDNGRLQVLLQRALRHEAPARIPWSGVTERPSTRPHRDEFVGRGTELVEVAELLRSRRQVTLTGPPGVGKSRLAAEILRRVAAEPGRRTVLVRLDGVFDPDEALTALAVAFEVLPGAPRQSPLEKIKSVAGVEECVIVLDNCEHLVPTCAALVDELLGMETVSVLTTSARPLQLVGETIYPLSPLPLPPPGTLTALEASEVPSVALFCARARALSPTFELTDELTSVVGEICRILEGMPLSIELSASRTAILSPAEILERLDDQLRLLRGRGRQFASRHDSLTSALGAAMHSLSSDERWLLTQLAVFVDTFSASGAEAVASDVPDVLDVLHGLVDASLVVADVSGDEAQFRLLESIRQYVRGHLTPTTELDVQKRRISYLAQLAGLAAENRHGPDRARWMRRLDTARLDLHAALDRTLELGDVGTALGLAADLWWWWSASSPKVGLEWYRRVFREADAISVDPAELLPAQLSAAVIASYVALREALGYGERALDNARLLEDRDAVVRAHQHIADIAHELGDLPRACAAADEAWRLAEESGAPWAIGICALSVAYNHLAAREAEAAWQWTEVAAQAFGRVADDGGDAEVLLVKAEVLIDQDRDEEGAELLDEALPIFRRQRNAAQTARAATILAAIEARRGRLAVANELVIEAFDHHSEVGHPWAIAHDLVVVAETCAGRGDHERACVLIGAADAVRTEAGLKALPRDIHVRAGVLTSCQVVLGSARSSQGLVEGGGKSLLAAVALGRGALSSRPVCPRRPG